MKTTFKISLVISFIASMDAIFSLISRTLNLLNDMNLDWLVQIISILGVFIAVYYLLSKYEAVKDSMIVSNIIGELRNKYFFLKSFEGHEFFKSSHETSEQFFKRIPEGQYFDYLKSEYEETKKRLIDEYDKKPSEAEEMIDLWYGFKTNKSSKKDEPNRDIK